MNIPATPTYQSIGLTYLRNQLEAIELVDDHCHTYTLRDRVTIDRDSIMDERATHIAHVLDELDGVVKFHRTASRASDQLSDRLMAEAVTRATALAAAIREVLGAL